MTREFTKDEREFAERRLKLIEEILDNMSNKLELNIEDREIRKKLEWVVRNLMRRLGRSEGRVET
jgi:hypothetical protein